MTAAVATLARTAVDPQPRTPLDRRLSLGPAPVQVCSFHRAMKEVHDTVSEVLTRWRLSDLLERPVSVLPDGTVGRCKMAFEGCDHFLCAPRDSSAAPPDPS